MFSVFGVVAVVLASVGLYGITSFAVNQRTQEFGIRMALGADQGLILRMVLRQAAWQLTLGLFVGLGLTLLVAVLGEEGINNFLFQISPAIRLLISSSAHCWQSSRSSRPSCRRAGPRESIR